MVISMLKMRKLRPEEVKWASITQTFDQPLFWLLWKPEVRKQVLFPDHEITVGQISSDFWCPKMVNSNTDRPVHNDTKHSCLSPWVSSQLRTRWHVPLRSQGTWGHMPHALTRAFLQSHILPQILSQCCRPSGSIKKMCTHLPVMPNMWTLITHLNSKKINRSHLSQPEKSSDSFTPFSQGFCGRWLLLSQPPGSCSPRVAQGWRAGQVRRMLTLSCTDGRAAQPAAPALCCR